MSSKKQSNRIGQYNSQVNKLNVKSFEAIQVQSLDRHIDFGNEIIALAQDIAYHHIKNTGLSATGIQCLSRTTPCWVLPKKSARKSFYVVGGLESLYMARAISLENSVYCLVLGQYRAPESLVSIEQERLLTIAPQYCRGGKEGAELLYRVWQFCNEEEENEIYGVTNFKEFASRLGVARAKQNRAPFAKTRANYTPGEQKQYHGL